MNIKIVNTLRRYHRLIVAFIVIISFFSSYNIFLIDATLEDLRFSLSQTAFAYDIKDTDGLDIILTRALAEEVAPITLASQDLMGLELATGIVTTGKSYRQLPDMTTSLRAVIKDKEDRRGMALTVLDTINSAFKKGVKYLTHLPQHLKARKAKPIAKEGLELFNKAKGLEKEYKLREAIACYSDFIKKYPAYERIALAKLRLAYCFQRIGEIDKAGAIYRQIIKNYPDEKESDIARSLLSQLAQRDKLVARMNAILAKTADLSVEDKEAAQSAYYELGAINAQLMDFEEAKKFFKRASEIDPQSELGVKSLFNYAWACKQTGDLKASLAGFNEIAKNKENVLASNSEYQVADIHHKEGRYQESINMYLEVANKSKNDSVSALCLFQAGASYMYDLNDDEKAKAIFAMLTSKYPNSLYAKYLMPSNPVGIFITYLVPRATRVVAWRAGGLLCLSGYSGEISKFSIKMDEGTLNRSFNKWLRGELPDTVGNLYVNILGAEVKLKDNLAAGSGNITMGKFDVRGEAEGKAIVTEDGQADAVITRARLAKIPIHPKLINNSLAGLSLIAKKNFPIMVKDVSIKKEEVSAQVYGGKRILERFKRFIRNFSGVEAEISELNPTEKDYYYKLFKERFPESQFSPLPAYSAQDIFLDFFTRMYLYSGFKILETVKDTKFDYERSIRTLGQLTVKEVNFGVDYTAQGVNTALERYIAAEFPMVINNEFFFDMKALVLNFTDIGEIQFRATLALSYLEKNPSQSELNLKGIAVMDIDQGSGLPVIKFKEVTLNEERFPVEKMNLVSERCLSLLKDSHVPIKLRKIEINEDGISLKGLGARDFVGRVFRDPDIFTIFMIRDDDLRIAGAEKLKERPKDITAFWRGRVIGDQER